MRRRWRDLVWLILILAIAALGFRQFRVSHELDGQIYQAELRGYARTKLEFKNGEFTVNRHTCTGSNVWKGRYWLEGDSLHLSDAALSGQCFNLRRSAGRSYLETPSGDYDRTLKLIEDASGGPHPPRWQGGHLEVNGIYPGMDAANLKGKLQIASWANGRAIYCSSIKDLAASVKGNRVVAVGGTQLAERNGALLLEAGEEREWVEECLGQKILPGEIKGLLVYPSGLRLGAGHGFYGGYYLGEVSEVDALRNAMFHLTTGI